MATLLGQVRTVAGQMMEDRGYAEARSELTQRFTDNLTNTLWTQEYAADGVDPTIVVVYPVVDADAVGELRAELEENGRVPLIIIALNKITPAARSTLAAEPDCEVFTGDFFKTNRYRDAMVPDMVRATEEEVADFLKRKRTTADSLARMYETEPVARYLAARPGEVFKFHVKLGFLQPIWRYRLVVPAT